MKLLTLVFLLFISSKIFSQNSYSNWISLGCQGLEMKYKKGNYYSKSDDKQKWQYYMRNTSSNAVSFDFAQQSYNNRSFSQNQGRVTIKPGEVYPRSLSRDFYQPASANGVWIAVSNFKINGQKVGCNEVYRAKTKSSSNQSKNPSNNNLEPANKTASPSNSYSETKQDTKEATKQSPDNLDTDNTSEDSDTKYNPATYKSPEQLEGERQAENRANKARIAEQERRRKKEEEAKARKKFREDRARAANQRQDVATAMGASSAILLVQIATIMYDGMGNHKGSDTYLGNQFYLGTNFGYSTTASTVSSIEETVNFNSPSTTSSELAHFVNINIDWDLFMGYEADNYGAEMEVGVRPGFFPLFTSFNLSSQIKWKAYGGLPFFKGYFDYQYGTRRWYIEQWISDVSSEASVLYNYDRFGLGIRGTFLNDGRNYSRSHLSLGFVWDRARQAIKPSSREISTSVNFKDESSADERARERKGFLSPFYTGVSIEWNKEHSFKLYARYFNSYPFIGPGAQAPERESGSYLFEFGFIRQIKSFK